jgi:hypothetical protein
MDTKKILEELSLRKIELEKTIDNLISDFEQKEEVEIYIRRFKKGKVKLNFMADFDKLEKK